MRSSRLIITLAVALALGLSLMNVGSAVPQATAAQADNAKQAAKNADDKQPDAKEEAEAAAKAKAESSFAAAQAAEKLAADAGYNDASLNTAAEAAIAAEYVDVLQIPAFLCRQTDLLTAAARTGKTVNIKKAQFLSGLDMQYPYEKARDAGASEIWLTERGNIYGYNNLVVDFRNIPDMLRIAQTVVMDCTHSVQRPGGAGGTTGGNREFVPAMARAARAFGANGFFFEVHPCPDCARSDGPNMLQLDDLENLIKTLL
mgnify:CR=1 FL=1